VRAGAALVAAAIAYGSAQAQTYPVKPIRLIVPLAPGGGADILSRSLAVPLSESLRQPVVVDNRPGGATMIGTELVAKSAPDGYTLVMASSSHAINPSLYPKTPFDPIKDFSAVTLIATSPMLLVVHPAVPAKTVKELAALAKSRPGKLNFASGGPAGIPHLAAELFKLMAGVDIVHVPYKGMGPALNELLGGQVDVLFSTPSASLPHVKTGKIRGLASTGAARSPAFPEFATIAESGYPGYEAGTWYALLAPAGTPHGALSRVNAETLQAIQVPAFRDRLTGLGVEFVGSTPEACLAYVRGEMTKWAKVVKAGNVRAE